MRDAGARRGPGRLLRRVPRRRPRHEDGAGRALRDARRRVPERRLHSVEGAAAHRGRHGRSRGARPRTASRSASRRSTSPSCAASRTGVVKKLTGGLAGMAKARKVEVVQRRRHASSIRITSKSRHDGDGRTGAKKVVKFEKAIIAAGSQAVKLPFMPEDPRIVDSTGALELDGDSEAHAGHRRRHHRPRDGDGVLDARHADRRGRDARRPDAGRRPRPGQGLGEVQRQALRQGHAEDQDASARRRRRTASRCRFEGEKAPTEPQTYDLVLVAVGRTPERQEDRRRQGRRRGHRPRLHRRRQADAHQRAAHLRDRRHRRPADARAQGGARRRTSRRKRRTARSRSSTRGRFRRSPTPIRRSPGPA